jgi:hypothetical protein
VWTDDVGYFISWVNIRYDFANFFGSVIPQQFAISNEDIQKIADAVKSKLSEDIVKIINEKTAPLKTKIFVANVSLVLMLLTSENIGVIYCQINCKQTIALPL